MSLQVQTPLLFVLLLIAPHYSLCGEYGEVCSTNVDCISTDTKNPLVCSNYEPPTTEEPPSTTEDGIASTTEDGIGSTTEDGIATTTEDGIGSTTEDGTTMTTEDGIASTTEDVIGSTTEDGTTTTTEDKTITTTEDKTITTTKDGTTTTADGTTTTADGTTTTAEDGSTSTTEDGTNSTTEDATNDMYLFERTVNPLGVCICPPEMIRDGELNRCVSPPSADCDLRYGDGGHMRTCTKFSQCYSKSAGNPEGTCYCDQDAVEDSATGTCRLNYGSRRCLVHSDCDVRNSLTCRNDTCVCMYDNLQKWNPEEEKCGYIVGESCEQKQHLPKPVCVENAVCPDATKICECNSDGGFIATPERECKLSYDASCNNDDECHPFFICSANTCTCPSGQTYFESTKRCHIPEGSSCEVSDPNACTVGAECKDGTCTCKSGYQSTGESTCHALYNTKCSEEIPCHVNEYLDECDPDRPFCNCKENYHYDSISKRCVGNIEEACRVDDDCVTHAICEGESCTCGGNYIPGANKTACYTHYGRPCSSISCFPDHFLKCSAYDRTCICASEEDQIFDESKGYCVALVGRPCGGSGNGIECVENSICAVEANAETRCKCSMGFASNSEGFCFPVEDDNSSVARTKLEIMVITFLFSFTIIHSLN